MRTLTLIPILLLALFTLNGCHLFYIMNLNDDCDDENAYLCAQESLVDVERHDRLVSQIDEPFGRSMVEDNPSQPLVDSNDTEVWNDVGSQASSN